MENSKIEWTTHTFNPWIGCQEVSPGCGGGEHGAPCYAKTMMDTRYRKVQWGPHGDRLRTSEGNCKQPPRWAKAARGSGERPRVFCASLADWLDNKAPQEWRVDLAALARLSQLDPDLGNFADGLNGNWLIGLARSRKNSGIAAAVPTK